MFCFSLFSFSCCKTKPNIGIFCKILRVNITMDDEYKSRAGTSYSSSRRRIANTAANTMRLLQDGRPTEAVCKCSANPELFAMMCDSTGMPEYVRMDKTFRPTSDDDVDRDDDSDDDDDDDDGANSLYSYNSGSDSDVADQSDVEKPALHAQLAQWAVQYNITDIALGKLLSILKPHHSNLPKDPRTLKKTPNTYEIKQVLGLDGGIGHYSHFGIHCGLMDLLRQQSGCNETTLVLQFNFDGLPLFKSSSMELWPVLCLVRQLNHRPFVVGLYCGAKKPGSLSDYLQDFVQELSTLLKKGVSCGDVHYGLELGCFVCDAPARAFLKNVKSHTAYYGCDKCKQKGVYIEGRMTFPNTDASLRTDEEVRQMSDDAHHHGPTPLAVLPVGLATGVVFDYMHLVCLGVCRRLINFWLRGPIHKGDSVASRLSAGTIRQLCLKIAKLCNSIPTEFARKPRSVYEVDRWKATEFRLFLLYTGPVLLCGVLSEVVYNHFLLLSVGITLLVSPKFCGPYADYAHSLLCLFVQQARHLYGEEFVVYNVHGLTHLAADVKRHGSLDCFSAFPYENKLKELKKLVRKPSCPLPQIIRRLSEERTTFSEICDVSDNSVMCERQHSDGPVPHGYDDAVQFTHLNAKTYKINIKRFSDCCVFVRSIGPVKVVNILSRSGTVYIVYKQFEQLLDLFESPLPSSSLEIYKVCGHLKKLFVCAFDDVLSKCILLPLSAMSDAANKKPSYAVLPVVHTFLDERA